jgi:hypothetical protein
MQLSIPYLQYHRLLELHENARDVPRMTNWSKLAAVVHWMMLDVNETEEPIAAITARAQNRPESLAEDGSTAASMMLRHRASQRVTVEIFV